MLPTMQNPTAESAELLLRNSCAAVVVIRGNDGAIRGFDGLRRKAFLDGGRIPHAARHRSAPDGQGDVTHTHIAWHVDKYLRCYVPSPCLIGQQLFVAERFSAAERFLPVCECSRQFRYPCGLLAGQVPGFRWIGC